MARNPSKVAPAPVAGTRSQPGGFAVDVRRTAHATVVIAQGAVDLFTGPQLTQAIDKALASDVPAVVIDLSEVDFLSSSGMSVLLQAREDAAATSTRVAVVADGPTTRRPLELLGLDRILDLYPTLDAALIEDHNQQITDAVAEIAKARSAVDLTKGILMAIYGLDEADAFDKLRAQARRTNSNLRALATQFRDDVATMSYEHGIPPQAVFDECFQSAHTRLGVDDGNEPTP